MRNNKGGTLGFSRQLARRNSCRERARDGNSWRIERERERERGRVREREGRERTFKYEEKRARYSSPALTVQTDSYVDLGGRQPPSTSFPLSLRSPSHRARNRQGKRNHEQEHHPEGATESFRKARGSPGWIFRSKSGDTRRNKSVGSGNVLVRAVGQGNQQDTKTLNLVAMTNSMKQTVIKWVAVPVICQNGDGSSCAGGMTLLQTVSCTPVRVLFSSCLTNATMLPWRPHHLSMMP